MGEFEVANVVLIGLDEHTASARISRYESSIHEPPNKIARAMAEVIGVPLGYLHCDEESLAKIILIARELPSDDQEHLIKSLKERLELLPSAGGTN